MGTRDATDLRQEALVYDWCQDLLNPSQKHQLESRLVSGIAAAAANDAVAVARARAMAAVALFDHVPQIPAQELDRVMRGWWGGKMVPGLAAGRGVVARED